MISFAGMIISFLYVFIYAYIRHADYLPERENILQIKKICLCYAVNLLISFHWQQPDKRIWTYLLMVIADIDILIQRIPMEFLVMLGVLEIRDIIINNSQKEALLCLITAVPWFFVYKKPGFALYDVYLIVILSAGMSGLRNVLLFDAFILILSGTAGLLVNNLRKRPAVKIPLSPLIISAVMLADLFL